MKQWCRTSETRRAIGLLPGLAQPAFRITLLVAAAALALGACSGGGDDSGDRGLRDAVQAYSGAFLTGDGTASYELLSARCQEREGREEWVSLVAGAGQIYGEPLEFTGYQTEVSGDRAKVTYTFERSEINQADEPWVYEHGAWRNDDCGTPPAELGATEVARRLAEQGMPVSDIATTTEDNDPNDMLGRQGGYLSRATFVLPGAEGGAEQDTERGGSIEVWPTDDAAVKRWEYLKGFQSSPLLGDGYDYVFGPAVLRIAKEVKPSVAEPFEAALRPAVAP
jgi:hypothetical protein